MEHIDTSTAAAASVEDVAECTARADAQVWAVLLGVMAQRRSGSAALDYVTALASAAKANCWSLAESAGHEGQYRMQGLLGSYRWDWKRLRDRLPALAVAWIPDEPQDLVGPGIAIDETAQLKKGDATACVAPQHAGCTGTVENCVTTVFSAYVTANGQAWADFDVYLPKRWAQDLPRRQAAGIPDDLSFSTKPQLAMDQLDRLVAAGLPTRWAAFDEVYGRSEQLRKKTAKAGWHMWRSRPVRLPGHRGLRHDDPRRRGHSTSGVRAPVLRERVQGTPLQRLGDDRHRDPGAVPADPAADLPPGQLHVLPVLGAAGRPATMTYFITIAGRRWPVEETFKTGKDVLGWDRTPRSVPGTGPADTPP